MISIFIAFTLCFLFYFGTRKFNHWSSKNVVGPKPIPFFGNIKDSFFRRKHLGIVYKEIYDQFPNEKVIGIYRMTSPALIIRDLDIVKQILVKDFDAFSERGINYSKEGLGDNLFHCDSATWRALRNRVSPLFSSGKMRNTVSLVDKYADQMAQYLDTSISKTTEQELHNIFLKYTMASTIGAAFSIDLDFFNEYQSFIEKAGFYAFRSTYAAEIDMLFPNILTKTNLSLYPKLLNKLCYDIVQTSISLKKGVSNGRSDLLDVLMAITKTQDAGFNEENKIQITDHVMAGQVFIFFVAGFGNNSLSLSYTLFQLAKHQDCQDRLIQEIDEVMAKYGGKLDYDALKEMTYLDKVFLEILRMNSLTNSIQRSAVRDYQIPGTDIVINKGTTVLVSPYAIHRDPELYPDPDHFDPERFSTENSADRHSCAYISFGVGPRSCVGRQLAKLQFFVAIVKIFSKFRVEPCEKTKKVEDYEPMSTLLATRGGVYVNIIPRKI